MHSDFSLCQAPHSIFADNKAVVCALSASYVSTFAGYPVSLAVFLSGICDVYFLLVGLHQVQAADDKNAHNNSKACDARLPGRGDHGILSGTVDTSNDDILCPCVRIPASLVFQPYLFAGAASFTIYSRTKENFRENNILCRDSIIDVSLTGGVSGAMSGALISFGSARMSPRISPSTHY